jgi:hypothetical protein
MNAAGYYAIMAATLRAGLGPYMNPEKWRYFCDTTTRQSQSYCFSALNLSLHPKVSSSASFQPLFAPGLLFANQTLTKIRVDSPSSDAGSGLWIVTNPQRIKR